MIRTAKQLLQSQWMKTSLFTSVNRQFTDQNRSVQKHARIKLDFYKNKGFSYSFLDIKPEAVGDNEATRYLRSHNHSNGLQSDTLESLCRQLQFYLGNHQQIISSILNANISNYKKFVENVEASPDLKKMSVIYNKINDVLLNMLDEKHMQKVANYDFIKHITSLAIRLRITNLDLWKKIIFYTLSFPEKFDQMPDLADTLMFILSFTQRFHFHEDTPSGYARSYFNFEERELTSILNKNLISTFFSKFDQYFIGEHDIKLKNMDSFCSILSCVCDLVNKLTKVSYINHYQERALLLKFEGVLLANLDKIFPDNCIRIFSTYVDMGISHEEFIQKFYSYFLQLRDGAATHGVLESLINAWRNMGRYDKKIYNELVRDLLIKNIQDANYQTRLPNLAFDLMLIKLDDIEIWKALLDHINLINIDRLYLFQKKSLHQVFQIFQHHPTIKIDLTPYRKLINQLSEFCIGYNIGYNLSDLGISMTNEEEGLIDCCHKETIEKYRTVCDTKLKGDVELKNKIKPHREQLYPNTFIETAITESIKQCFPVFFSKPVNIIREKQLCLYRIDLAVEIPDVYDKIAIEISGISYSFGTGQFIAKKQNRAQYLKRCGWILVNVEIGKDISHNLMGIASSTNREKIAKCVYDAMRTELKKSLNVNLPEVKSSKWTILKNKGDKQVNNKNVPPEDHSIPEVFLPEDKKPIKRTKVTTKLIV